MTKQNWIKNWSSLRDGDRDRVRCSGWTVPRELHAEVRALAGELGVTQSSLVEEALRALLQRQRRGRAR